eukprot:162811-Chlamydomonas_euryale.AAC.1
MSPALPCPAGRVRDTADGGCRRVRCALPVAPNQLHPECWQPDTGLERRVLAATGAAAQCQPLPGLPFSAAGRGVRGVRGRDLELVRAHDALQLRRAAAAGAAAGRAAG